MAKSNLITGLKKGEETQEFYALVAENYNIDKGTLRSKINELLYKTTEEAWTKNENRFLSVDFGSNELALNQNKIVEITPFSTSYTTDEGGTLVQYNDVKSFFNYYKAIKITQTLNGDTLSLYFIPFNIVQTTGEINIAYYGGIDSSGVLTILSLKASSTANQYIVNVEKKITSSETSTGTDSLAPLKKPETYDENDTKVIATQYYCSNSITTNNANYYTKAQVDDKTKNFITTIPDELTPTKITMKDGSGTIEGVKQITNAGGSDGSFDIYCTSSTNTGANPFVNFWNGYPATKGARLNLTNLTGIRIFYFPDKDGTLATTDDVNKSYSIRLHPGDIPGVADTATSATIAKNTIQPFEDIKIGDIVMDYYQPNENELDIGFWKVESISGDNITIKGTLDPELGDVKIKAPEKHLYYYNLSVGDGEYILCVYSSILIDLKKTDGSLLTIKEALTNLGYNQKDMSIFVNGLNGDLLPITIQITSNKGNLTINAIVAASTQSEITESVISEADSLYFQIF